jgi:hypothetical protein
MVEEGHAYAAIATPQYLQPLPARSRNPSEQQLQSEPRGCRTCCTSNTRVQAARQAVRGCAGHKKRDAYIAELPSKQ